MSYFTMVEGVVKDPVRIFIASGCTFKPGNIGQLKEIDGRIVCELSDGSNPFGIIANEKRESSEFSLEDFVHIYPQRMVFRTNLFDIESSYKIGSGLYVKNGLLTTKPANENSYIVARIISPPAADRVHLEALWL